MSALRLALKPAPSRNAFALQAMTARAAVFKDRRVPRGGSRNWSQLWMDDWLDDEEIQRELADARPE